MVWENHVCVIVMLARFIEKRKVKAHCYWPTEPEQVEVFNAGTDSEVSVTLEKKQQLSEGITMHHFILSNATESRKLIHLHYTGWPDFGVPESTEAIRELKRVSELYAEREQKRGAKKKYPILVHCSAGIGRAGTFLAYLSYCQQIRQGIPHNELSVASVVSHLRKQRMCMVQTKEQFHFIYQLLEDEFTDVETAPGTPVHRLRDKRLVSKRPQLKTAKSYCTPRSMLRTTQNGLKVNTLSISTA